MASKLYSGLTCRRFGKMDAAKEKKLPAKAFGLPGQRKYPMPDPAHAKNAKARASAERKRGKLTPQQFASINRKADRVIAKCSSKRR